MKIEQIKGADSTSKSLEMTLANVGKVPEQLVKKLKEELPERLKEAVVTNVLDLRDIMKKNSRTTCEFVLLSNGFKKLKGVRMPGTHFALKAASGDKQEITIIKEKNNSGTENVQIHLRTTIGDTCSGISYFKNRPKTGGEETIINNLYNSKTGKLMRLPLSKTNGL